jgi:hypothetical protein
MRAPITQPTWHRRLAAGGIAGPAVFSLSWLVGGARQANYALATEHISGLAALDARNPEVMVAGFVTLGVGAAATAVALRSALRAGPGTGTGPWWLGGAGLAALAAGFLRRDTLLLIAADDPSWHNRGHDLASAAAYLGMVAAPLVLARRFRGDPRWENHVPWSVAAGVAVGALLVIFASDVAPHANGIIQRVAVTISLVWLASVATHLVRGRAAR